MSTRRRTHAEPKVSRSAARATCTWRFCWLPAYPCHIVGWVDHTGRRRAAGSGGSRATPASLTVWTCKKA
eukprot:7386553-Prymnesium_polylepis.1